MVPLPEVLALLLSRLELMIIIDALLLLCLLEAIVIIHHALESKSLMVLYYWVAINVGGDQGWVDAIAIRHGLALSAFVDRVQLLVQPELLVPLPRVQVVVVGLLHRGRQLGVVLELALDCLPRSSQSVCEAVAINLVNILIGRVIKE